MDNFTWYAIFGMCAGIALVLALIEAFGVNPHLKRMILAQTEEGSQFNAVRFDKKPSYTESPSGK